MARVRVNGASLNYTQMDCEKADACEDVVMIHGLAASSGFWGVHCAPAFTRRYRVTIFDLRGHGRSEMTETGYSPSNLAVDLQQLLDLLGIGKAHFVAHSFGGVIALKLALVEPWRIASLTLADTHIAAVRKKQKDLKWHFGMSIQPILHRNGIFLDVDDTYFGYRLLTEIARRQSNDQQFTPEFQKLVSSFAGRLRGRSATQWLKLMDSTRAETEIMRDDELTLQELKAFRFPILAVYGEHSQSMLTGRHLLDVWPHADFRCVRNAGHFFPVSQPGRFMNICEQFWNGALAGNYPRRKGDPVKSHFRSSRMYQDRGGWFFSTREKTRRGPFRNIEDAERVLREHVAGMTRVERDPVGGVPQCQ